MCIYPRPLLSLDTEIGRLLFWFCYALESSLYGEIKCYKIQLEKDRIECIWWIQQSFQAICISL